MRLRRRAAPVSWGEAESAEIGERARVAAIEASGQRGVRVVRVDLDEHLAIAHVLLLEGESLAVLVHREMGRWCVKEVRHV